MSCIRPTLFPLKSGETASVRSAGPEDAAALLAHGRAVVREAAFLITEPEEFTYTEDQERDFISQYLEAPGKLLIVADVADELAGAAFCECGSRRRLAHRATLHLSVSQQWRGRGVGTALLRTVISWAEAHPGVEKLSLAVFSTNSAALGLYRKLGFIEEGRRPREIRLGPGEYADDILMYRFV
jgi:RimJ/RimL family protein N-acetyltransferase